MLDTSRFSIRHLAPLAVLIALALVACGGADEVPRTAEEQPAPAVEAVPARLGSLPLEEQLSGVLKANNQVAIHPEISAPILEVYIRNGETVERGQALVRLDDQSYREQLRQSEANLRLAEARAAESRARVGELEALVSRTRKLAAENLVSELDLETREAQLSAARAGADQTIAQVEQARATVDERRSMLDRTVVRAPISGRVGQRDAEVGMLADSGSVLFILGDFDELVVEVPLTQGMLAEIEEGQPVEIHSPMLGDAPLRARLTRISPFLKESSFSTLGEIEITNPDGRLRPGMFVDVTLLYGESETATLVPTSALWEDPQTGLTSLFVVRGMDPAQIELATLTETAYQVEKRTVEVIAEGRAAVGVRGVEEGEWVVTVGQNLLEKTSRGEDSTEEGAAARVRAVTWERVLELQGLQRENLLTDFLAKQERLARTLGAAPPKTGEILVASPAQPAAQPLQPTPPTS